MTLVIYKALAALAIFLTSIIAVVYPLKTQRQTHADTFELGEAFASGIFLGVAFFHLLPHAIDVFRQAYPSFTYPIAEAICMASFLFLIFLDRLSCVTSKINPQQNIPYIMSIILIIHALTEGAALGIESSLTETFILFIAIIAHKGSASFALCITLMRYHLPYWRILGLILLFSLMTPLGIGLGTFIQLISQSKNGDLISGAFNAFAAGSFIYIATMLHIRFHEDKHKDQSVMVEYASLLFGVLLMGVIAIWL